MFMWWAYEYGEIWNRNNGKSNLRLLYFQLHSKVFLSKYLVLFRNGKASVCRLVLEWFPIPPDPALEQDLSYSQIPVFPNTQHNVVCLFQKYHWMFSELHEIRMIHFRHFVYIRCKFFNYNLNRYIDRKVYEITHLQYPAYPFGDNSPHPVSSMPSFVSFCTWTGQCVSESSGGSVL